MARQSLEQQEALARQLVKDVQDRAVVSAAVGILRVWGECDAPQARVDLQSRRGPGGSEAKAGRVVALVNAVAEGGRADPDWGDVAR